MAATAPAPGPTVTCPECRHLLAVPAHYVGKNWRCPDCRTAFVPADARTPPRRRGLIGRALDALLAAWR